MSEGAGRPPGAPGSGPRSPDGPREPTASEILRALREPIDAARAEPPFAPGPVPDPWADESAEKATGSPADATLEGPAGRSVPPRDAALDPATHASAPAPDRTPDAPAPRSPRARTEGRFARWYVEPRVRAEEEEPWLLTYLDTITLLLVMMIVLLIFAGPPVPPGQHRRQPAQTDSAAPAKAPDAAPSADRAEGGPPGPKPEVAAKDGAKDASEVKPADAAAPAQAAGAGGESKDASPVVDLTQLSPNIRMERRPDEIRFRLDSEILFASGNAALLPAGQAMIDELLPVFGASPDQEIVVGGHTDDVPVRGWRFPSNWELAAGRAASVVRHLESRGITPSRLRAVAFGDTRPIAPNDTAEGRAANRRVEISIENKARADQPGRSEALRQKQ